LAGGDDRARAAINKPAHARRAGRRVYPPFMRVDFVVSLCVQARARQPGSQPGGASE